MSSSTTPPHKRPLYQNIISQLGFLTAVGGSVVIAILMLAQMVTPNPYIGMFTYLMLPAVILGGVIAILAGMRWEAGRRKRQASLATLPYPRVDLNDPRQRKIFSIAIIAGTIVGTTMIWAGYEGYIYTESVTFCGQTCHVAMQPEYTAYLDSAHARVRCVDCHVGEGAGYYVRSKVQGAKQLLGVITDHFERPIPTPIMNLRPARETCERCHWPEKFFGAKLLQLPHYRFDEANTPEQITLTLKTGGGTRSHGASGGVHWHMVLDNSVTYAATDPQLQDIPWVKVRHSDGTFATYVSKLSRLSEDQLGKLPRHAMDCMDCHNRPAHNFPSPDGGIDVALFKGNISPTLPWIKKLTVDSMMLDYPTLDAAHRAIRDSVIGTYREKYPQILADRKADIDKAITVASDIYDRAVFPDMHVNWHTYPVNIGHRHWPGCFRCHDGQHVSSEGKVLGNDCSKTCHTQPQRGPQTALGVVDPAATPNWHPFEMPNKSVEIPGHERLLCSNCHKAGRGPKRVCDDCHTQPH